MSVDTPAEENPTGKPNTLVMEEGVVPSAQAEVVVNSPSIPDGHGVAATADVQSAVGAVAASGARRWFEGLRAEERLATLGFVDDAFLSMLSLLVSSSTALTDTSSVGKVKEISWDSMFSVSVSSALYRRSETTVSKTAEDGENTGEGNIDQSSSNDQSSPKYRPLFIEEDREPDIFDSDAFRIRSKPATSAVVQKRFENDTVEPGPSPTIFDRICVVFPAAFNFVSGKALDGTFPYVTVKQSVLENSSDEELLLALDSFSRSVWDIPFLSYEAIATFKPPLLWTELIEQRSGSDAMVPLYALLLARFECAVFEAYGEADQVNRSCPLSITCDVSTSNDIKDVARCEEEVIIPERNSSAQEAETASEDKNTRWSDTGGRSVMRMSMNDIVTHARTICDRTSTTDPSSLKSLLEPVLKIFLKGQENPLCRLEDLLLTPLLWLLQAGGNNTEGVIDFSMCNSALDSALRRTRSSGPSKESNGRQSKHVDSKVNGEPKEKESQPNKSKQKGQGTKGTQSAASGAPGTSQKKKKRKKKKKGRKSCNAESSAASSKEVSSNQPVMRGKESSLSSSKGSPIRNEVVGTKIAKKVDHSPVSGQDTVKTEAPAGSVVADAASVRSDISTQEDKKSLSISGKGDITVSRVEGILVVATPVSEPPTLSTEVADEGPSADQREAEQDDDAEAWETVEVRGRSSRKKSSSGSLRNSHHPSSLSATTPYSDSHPGGGKKAKGVRTTASRKRNANRKIVRDILSSLLDTVDEEVRAKKPSPSKPAINPWKNGPPGVKSTLPGRKEKKPSAGPVVGVKKETTLRDVVLGRHTSVSKESASSQKKSPSCPTDKLAIKKDPDTCINRSPHSKRMKGSTLIPADQNTAPTFQETVSAVSTASNAVVDAKRSQPSTRDRVSKSDSSSGDTEEAPQNQDRAASTPESKDASAAPPLPTLLSPENANSANSSVASSLEVPHSSHRHHHSAVGVNDVGYHLLDVCDRLSRDMSLFMSRRALALNARRRERGALLASLQDCVASIWPGCCHVETYGSCATQLDLPSSDLDVVIVGLDRNMDVMINPPTVQEASLSKSTGSEGAGNCHSMDDKAMSDEAHQHFQSQQLHFPVATFVPMHLHTNRERVMRLAAELEAQPWAVQVKAIPTASVPVIKVLADPSRLASASHGGDWMVHHQQLAAQAADAARHSQPPFPTEELASSGGTSSSRQHFHPQRAPPPWRGADVMNGLLPLDITFEGFGHGGIGSTKFSARVISEVCQESGLHPDATAFVQVVMVLKELLVQRKLNEPYSGGLSSYALLLLVVALMRERAVIQEEIERVERQRKAVADGDVSGSFASTTASSVATTKPEKKEDRGTVPDLPSNPKGKSSGDGQSSQPQTKKMQGVGTAKGAAKSTSNGSGPQQDIGIPRQTNSMASDQTSWSGRTALSSKSAGSSWACIAKKNAPLPAANRSVGEVTQKSDFRASQTNQCKGGKATQKPPTFASVARTTQPTVSSATSPHGASETLKPVPNKVEAVPSKDSGCESTRLDSLSDPGSNGKIRDQTSKETNGCYVVADCPLAKSDSGDTTSGRAANSSVSLDSSLVAAPPFFPRGFNDTIEVLCSGETTAGKLLMHFLLFYGQHFDAQGTAIDISGKHERDFTSHAPPYSYLSPYIQRRAPGTFDSVTGMLTVDPIVIYDALEGAEHNNVARRCFAWSSVRWIFAQSYATLSSAVERSATPPTTPGSVGKTTAGLGRGGDSSRVDPVSGGSYNPDAVGDLMDPASPLLRCLLSF